MAETQVQYKVIEPNEDFTKAKIEKTSLESVSFTIEDLNKYQNDYSTKKRELTAQLEVEEATVKNVEINHPFVLDMSEEDLYTAWFYMDSKNKASATKKLVDEYSAALSRYQTEKEAIYSALAFKEE